MSGRCSISRPEVGALQQGYTIIEVTLFLAISGLLLLVAVLTTGGTIRNLRFTDSGNSLEAYVQKQYDNVLAGVNSRDNQQICNAGSFSSGTQEPGTSNCFFMGKLILFTTGDYKLKTYNIVGTEPSNLDFSMSDEQLIAAYQPRIVTSIGPEEYSIPWQAYISGVRRVSTADASPIAANALAIIRSPSSTRMLTYTYKEPASTPTVALTSIVNNASINAGKITNYCLQNADNLGQPAKLVVNGMVSNQNAAQIVFDQVAPGDCNGS
ncbi:MAG TPA: hypothetical protein VLA77_00260 [Candidatus Saccharimonadales bacterium]|nr:hypothetical protein [Candidatus Saccharimonadales bacterium]